MFDIIEIFLLNGIKYGMGIKFERVGGGCDAEKKDDDGRPVHYEK